MFEAAGPEKTLSVFDAVAIVVGTVVGVGIFKTPSVVAANASGAATALLFWLAGGLASLAGALCYAELMCAYPHAGGDYHYLTRAFGRAPSFLYAWARIAVIQTGSIAMVAFLIGDYASVIFHLGPFSSSVYAALAVILFTAVNMAGIRQDKAAQIVLAAGIVAGLVTVSALGLFLASSQPAGPAGSLVPEKQSLGTAMIFVLLTYGGWNEASFLSAEIRAGRRNILKVLLISVGCVTALYLLVNLVLLKGLGREAMASSGTVVADLMRLVLGAPGDAVTSVLILLAAASTLNAAMITGARTAYALGQDCDVLAFLGRWQGARHTPVNALLAQGAAALALVALGTGAPDGFVMMVEYTAPVFWLFFSWSACP
ncbi:MAG: APC family permease [Syntrophaceae bacterium]|nr:APC family permease [Syntrophaceae bacterium]